MLGIVSLSDLVLGLLAGFLIGWILELMMDKAARKRERSEYGDELESLQRSFDEAKVTKAAALHKLQEAEEERDNAVARNNALETHVGQLTVDKKMFEDEVKESRTRLRQLASLEQANETLRKKLTSAENRARDLNSQNEGLNANVQTLNSVQNDVDQYKSRISQLETEKQSLRDKLAQAETELATMGANYSTNMEDASEIDELRINYQQATQELQRLRANATTNTADSEFIDSMRNQLAEMEARLESAEEQLLHEQNRVVSAEVKLQNMADKLTDERLHTQAIEQELNSLRAGGTAPVNGMMMSQSDYSPPTDMNEMVAEIDVTSFESAESVDEALFVTMDEVLPEPGVPKPISNGTQMPGDPSDRLQQINGIGNVFAGRLQAAGINTFEELAQISPERAVEIVKAKPWQVADAEAWISQAREFAGM